MGLGSKLFIDRNHLGTYAGNQLSGIGKRLFARFKAPAELFQFSLDRHWIVGVALKIVAEKKLQGNPS
jgi:hypothetical protein